MMGVREKERRREARLFYMKEDTMGQEQNSRACVYVSVCGWREVSGLSLLVLRSIFALIGRSLVPPFFVSVTDL